MGEIIYPHTCGLAKTQRKENAPAVSGKPNLRERYESKTDPITGFARSTTELGRTHPVPWLLPVNFKSMSYNPRLLHSNRLGLPFAPPPTRRASERDPGGPYTWNQREFSEKEMVAQLYAASSRDLSACSNCPEKSEQDKLALKYIYSSTTSRAYADIPWDSTLPPRQWSAVSTLEAMPQAGYSLLSNKRVLKKVVC